MKEESAEETKETVDTSKELNDLANAENVPTEETKVEIPEHQ